MVQKSPLKKQAELVTLVRKSIVVSVLLATVCMALSYFSVTFSQSVSLGGFRGGAALRVSGGAPGAAERSRAREQSAFLAGCPGLGPRSRSSLPCRNSSSVCPGCQELLQQQRVLLPCATSVWTSPQEPALVRVRILESSAFLVRFDGVFRSSKSKMLNPYVNGMYCQSKVKLV